MLKLICDRATCGETYDKDMSASNEQTAPLKIIPPEGWIEVDGCMVCPNCAKQFYKFMAGGTISDE